jgi:transposase
MLRAEIYIAVPGDRDPQPVRCFPTFTEDLHAAAAWLKACHIETVAMESTGVYWIPLFQILEARGFQVFLVNAHHVKNVPGRKSDVSDCQWLQYLHSVGLLRGSFRPEQAVCSVRSILRHRDSLVQMASSHVQHMQKALDQMNLQLHHVISGPDFSRFPSGPEFASWLGLCSDNRVSGGKVLSVKTRKGKNRAATALRMAALSVHRSQSFLDTSIAGCAPNSVPPRPSPPRRTNWRASSITW